MPEAPRLRELPEPGLDKPLASPCPSRGSRTSARWVTSLCPRCQCWLLSGGSWDSPNPARAGVVSEKSPVLQSFGHQG